MTKEQIKAEEKADKEYCKANGIKISKSKHFTKKKKVRLY